MVDHGVHGVSIHPACVAHSRMGGGGTVHVRSYAGMMLWLHSGHAHDHVHVCMGSMGC